MPYTPPAQHSPNASRPDSPVISRRSSYTQTLQQQHQFARTNANNNAQRPQLPRSAHSASYLHRHRRSPSLRDSPTEIQGQILTQTPDATPTAVSFGTGLGASVRQSPPPVNDQPMPTGAVISPPDSTQNSSDDDEEALKRGRKRELENLAELQAVVKDLEQKRQGSPFKAETGKIKLQLGLPGATAVESPTSPGKGHSPDSRISHTRSATDSAIIDVDRPVETPDRSADSDEEDGRYQKPLMLRKKSGELVRPALRPASAKRRPSSMPGTPTYAKAVHFDNNLEHVRTFLQVDRPLAVSANSSPVETYEGDSEFPFETQRDPPWQWDITLTNFPVSTPERKQRPVHVEKVFLSTDSKTLIGTVAVKNLAFHKLVVARFTLDYWKTTSEVTAEYSHDVRRTTSDNLDRFSFNIKLEDLANLESKTLFFCVRYNVNGQEFWDSNGNVNFQVDFSKKAVPQKGKKGMSGNAAKPLASLPRSRPSPPSSGRPRPKSAPSFDDFSHGFGAELPAPFVLNDTPIKFRPRPSQPAPISPSLAPKTTTQAFGNRYDFAASLSAAISRAGLSERRPSPSDPSENETEAVPKVPTSTPAVTTTGGFSQPAALTANALGAGAPELSSQSYNELIDKYCFFGSGKSGASTAASGANTAKGSSSTEPAGGGTRKVTSAGAGAYLRPSAPAQLDGADDYSNASSRTSSGGSSPLPEPEREEPPPVSSPRLSRSTSPATGLERGASPISFGYPYHTARGGIFTGSEGQWSPAIQS